MRLSDCFEKRLLKRGRADILKSKKALEIAESKLRRAEALCEHGFYEDSIVVSYTAMFQSARALLLKDEIFERSHYCVVEYLRENYVKKQILDSRYIGWLDTYRIERHETLYGLELMKVSKEDAEDAINKSLDFISTVEKLIIEATSTTRRI